MISATFAYYACLREFSVLLGRLGQQRSFLTISLPGSPRALTRSSGFSLGSSVSSDHHLRRRGDTDVRHLSSEGSIQLSCTGFLLLCSCCGNHISNSLLHVCNMWVYGSVF